MTAPTERDLTGLLSDTLGVPVRVVNAYKANLKASGQFPLGRRGPCGGDAYVSLRDSVSLLVALLASDTAKHASAGLLVYGNLPSQGAIYEGPARKPDGTAGTGRGQIWFDAADLSSVFPLGSLVGVLRWMVGARALGSNQKYSVVHVGCASGDRPIAQVKIVERGHALESASFLFTSSEDAGWLHARLNDAPMSRLETLRQTDGTVIEALGDLFSRAPEAVDIENVDLSLLHPAQAAFLREVYGDRAGSSVVQRTEAIE